MSLEPLAQERQREVLKTTFIVIGIWTLWLLFISTLSYSHRLSLSAVAIVLLFGSFWWNLTEGAFFILLMSWIFHGFSLTPPGFYWISIFCVFAILKIASYRFSVRSPQELGIAVLIAALLCDFSQLFFLKQISPIYVFSFSTLGFIILSAFLQTGLALLLMRPLLSLLATK